MAHTGQDMGEFWDKLKEMGLMPGEDCSRVIIDIPCMDSVKVYYECFADKRMFEIDMAAALKGAEVISVADMK